MASPDDLLPQTSYSDPFYDRLESAAHYLRKFWWAVALLLVLVIALVFITKALASRRPEAAAAARFIAAAQAREPADRQRLLEALAADAQAIPLFRARAQIELTQIAIDKPDTATALAKAREAVTLATASEDLETVLAAKLSLAAAMVDAGDLDGATPIYAEVERGAGGRFAAQSLEAQMGTARIAARQKRFDDALAKLEPLSQRNDAGAENQLGLARALYWTIKREQLEAGGATGAALATPAPALVPTIESLAIDQVGAVTK